MTETHDIAALLRLGVEAKTVARLQRYAVADDMSLRDFVCFVLRDYAPPSDWWPPSRSPISPNQCGGDATA